MWRRELNVVSISMLYFVVDVYWTCMLAGANEISAGFVRDSSPRMVVVINVELCFKEMLILRTLRMRSCILSDESSSVARISVVTYLFTAARMALSPVVQGGYEGQNCFHVRC